MQEDLASLFSRNLSISQQPAIQTPVKYASHQASHAQAQEEGPTPIVYSISQHYHHSAHLASSAPATPSASTFAAAGSITDRTSAEVILSRNGIDPGLLSSPQIMMFQQADVSEQMRLISKWTSSPPNYGFTPGLGTSPSASVQTDEIASPLQSPSATLDDLRRWHDQGAQSSSMKQDAVGHLLVPFQGGDFRPLDGTSDLYPEPYIISGYDSLAQRDYIEQAERIAREQQELQRKGTYAPLGSAVGGGYPQRQSALAYHPATDPVYQAQSGAWQKMVGQPEQQQQQRVAMDLAMACQYGAYDQMAHFGGQSQAQEKVVTVHDSGMDMDDEEML